ncbi:brachyurin-like [Colias croceus]|uniref:brachyurin-like n=1 Tax=Colias crocea TaxID=72248 RepID=UPI001E27A363|nr:brachyurin-like [Colias croceus]
MVCLQIFLIIFLTKFSIASNVDIENLSIYNYHLSTGIPEAARLMASEAKYLAYSSINQVVGGRATDISHVPYQAGLVIKVLRLLTSICGGSLITPTRVVTAAHCIYDGNTRAQDITVVLGSSHIFSGGERMDSDGSVIHTDWNPNTTENDIAIVFISPVNFTDVIEPIRLPSQHELNENFIGWTALASGFGLTKSGGTIPRNQYLNSVHLKIISNEQCQAVYGDIVRATNICTDGSDGRGTCNGDSGGPLTVDNKGKRILIGITSFGASAGCDKGFPAAYTRVTSYVSWILTI